MGDPVGNGRVTLLTVFWESNRREERGYGRCTEPVYFVSKPVYPTTSEKSHLLSVKD